MPHGYPSPVTRSSTDVPSTFDRWILAVPESVQYILPCPSSAMPVGLPSPVTRSSTGVPSTFDRWILAVT